MHAHNEHVRTTKVELLRPTEPVTVDGLGRFAGVLSRELNSLLGAIRYVGTLLRQSFDTSDPRRAGVGLILSATDRAVRVVAQLHGVSRGRALRRVDVVIDPHPPRKTQEFRPAAMGERPPRAD